MLASGAIAARKDEVAVPDRARRGAASPLDRDFRKGGREVQSNSSMRHWLLGFVTGSLLFGFSGRLLAQPPPNAAELVATRLEALETEQARLHESGDVQAAEQLAKQLSDARAILAGDLTSASTEQVELHAVGIAVGGAVPPGVLQGKDRFTRGYAEISVSHTSAPLLLFVGAVERTHFRFNVDAGRTAGCRHFWGAIYAELHRPSGGHVDSAARRRCAGWSRLRGNELWRRRLRGGF